MDMAVDQARVGNRLQPSLSARLAKCRSLSSWGLASISNLAEPSQQRLLAQRRCGCIVTASGSLVTIHGRHWPYHGNLLRAAWDARYGSLPTDVCELYYHQPASMPNFLTLSYVHAGSGTSLTTLYTASLVLDEVARLRGTDAIVCNVTNSRISDRLLQRWGWQAHCLHWRGRHFIKRFYGQHPPIPEGWRKRFMG